MFSSAFDSPTASNMVLARNITAFRHICLLRRSRIRTSADINEADPKNLWLNYLSEMIFATGKMMQVRLA